MAAFDRLRAMLPPDAPIAAFGLRGVPILQAGLRDDRIVPFAQQERFHARLPDSTELVPLDRGDAFYVHGGADAGQLAGLRATQEAFARRCLRLGASSAATI